MAWCCRCQTSLVFDSRRCAGCKKIVFSWRAGRVKLIVLRSLLFWICGLGGLGGVSCGKIGSKIRIHHTSTYERKQRDACILILCCVALVYQEISELLQHHLCRPRLGTISCRLDVGESRQWQVGDLFSNTHRFRDVYFWAGFQHMFCAQTCFSMFSWCGKYAF